MKNYFDFDHHCSQCNVKKYIRTLIIFMNIDNVRKPIELIPIYFENNLSSLDEYFIHRSVLARYRDFLTFVYANRHQTHLCTLTAESNRYPTSCVYSTDTRHYLCTLTDSRHHLYTLTDKRDHLYTLPNRYPTSFVCSNRHPTSCVY